MFCMDEHNDNFLTRQCRKRLKSDCCDEVFIASLQAYPYRVLCGSAATVLRGCTPSNVSRLDEFRALADAGHDDATQVLPETVCEPCYEERDFAVKNCESTLKSIDLCSHSADVTYCASSFHRQLQLHSPFRYASTSEYKKRLIRRSSDIMLGKENGHTLHDVMASMHDACLDARCHGLLPSPSASLGVLGVSHKDAPLCGGISITVPKTPQNVQDALKDCATSSSHVSLADCMQKAATCESRSTLGVKVSSQSKLGRSKSYKSCEVTSHGEVRAMHDLCNVTCSTKSSSLLGRVEDNLSLLRELLGDVDTLVNDKVRSSHSHFFSGAPKTDSCEAQHDRHAPACAHSDSHLLTHISSRTTGNDQKVTCVHERREWRTDVLVGHQQLTNNTGVDTLQSVTTYHHSKEQRHSDTKTNVDKISAIQDERVKDVCLTKDKLRCVSEVYDQVIWQRATQETNMSLPNVSSPCEFAAKLTQLTKRHPLPCAFRTRRGDVVCEKKWQILVDVRERVASKHENVCALFRKHALPFASVQLPAGDFMINVQTGDDHSTTSGATDADAWDCYTVVDATMIDHNKQSAEQSSSPHHGKIARSANSPDCLDPTKCTFAENCDKSCTLYSHLFQVIFERKTIHDLDASVIGTRYSEQRRLLHCTGYRQIIWIVEGHVPAVQNNAYNSHEDSTRGHVSTSMMYAHTAGYDRDTARQKRIYSACAALTIRDRFIIVHTRSIDETILFIKMYAARLLALVNKRHIAEHTDTSTKILSPTSCHIDESRTMTSCTESNAGQRFARLHPTRKAWLVRTQDLLNHTANVQRRLAAATAFPRMLSCIRGCTPALAMTLVHAYGNFLRLWERMKSCNQERFDEETAELHLTMAQKKLVILLSEFLAAQQYD